MGRKKEEAAKVAAEEEAAKVAAEEEAAKVAGFTELAKRIDPAAFRRMAMQSGLTTIDQRLLCQAFDEMR